MVARFERRFGAGVKVFPVITAKIIATLDIFLEYNDVQSND